MHVELHANATTTPRTRAYIQQSSASNTSLARELGVGLRTVVRWKTRREVLDRSHTPHRLAIAITDWEEPCASSCAVYLEILPDRRAKTAAFLARFLASFPLQVHSILTDNGSEFTDRFAADKPHKPKDKPSGNHPFDALCRTRAIRHRLTQPFHPQTNAMVERFNRRIGEHLNRMRQNRAAHHRRFVDHAERDAYLITFVADYNQPD